MHFLFSFSPASTGIYSSCPLYMGLDICTKWICLISNILALPIEIRNESRRHFSCVSTYVFFYGNLTSGIFEEFCTLPYHVQQVTIKYRKPLNVSGSLIQAP